MPDIRADAIAVYVYRRTAAGIEFLQIHRSDSTGEYQRSWQTVYGGVESLPSPPHGKKETAVQAALRELREETHLVPINMWQVEYLESFYFKPHDYVLVMPVFAVEINGDEPITLNAEHDAFRWVPEQDIPTHFMWRTQREALQYVLEGLRSPSAAASYLAVDLTKEA
ncbi:MAG TPA: NUDIX domain-containing protein [Phycisphaerae bacterium]|nr:NUDIX domain-containing protein [Phycisphaerae bacterium]